MVNIRSNLFELEGNLKKLQHSAQSFHFLLPFLRCVLNCSAVCSQEGPLHEDYDESPDPEDEYCMAAEEGELTTATRAGKRSRARLLFQELFIFLLCPYCFSAASAHFPAEK